VPEEGLSRGALDRNHDRVKHAAGIFQYLIIPEPQHAKPLIFEPSGTPKVGLVIGVLTTIHFYNEMFLEADKIDDIFSDHRLTLEFCAFESVGAKEVPEPALGVSHIAAESFSPSR
jgi:hypothetical protein